MAITNIRTGVATSTADRKYAQAASALEIEHDEVVRAVHALSQVCMCVCVLLSLWLAHCTSTHVFMCLHSLFYTSLCEWHPLTLC